MILDFFFFSIMLEYNFSCCFWLYWSQFLNILGSNKLSNGELTKYLSCAFEWKDLFDCVLLLSFLSY
jgi:hypothetical protein